MAMSKKDFIALAEYLTDEAIVTHCGIAKNKWEFYVDVDSLREHLANFCHSRNSAFKRQRWLGYIKGENGPSGGKR